MRGCEKGALVLLLLLLFRRCRYSVYATPIYSFFSFVTSVTLFILARMEILFYYVWWTETFSDRYCDIGRATRNGTREHHHYMLCRLLYRSSESEQPNSPQDSDFIVLLLLLFYYLIYDRRDRCRGIA